MFSTLYKRVENGPVKIPEKKTQVSIEKGSQISATFKKASIHASV